jgi:hypothetical protein
MLSFLFWNLGKKDLTARVARLARKVQADVVMLAEHVGDPAVLLAALNRESTAPYSYPASTSSTIRLFTRLPRSRVVEKYNDDFVGLNIRQLKVRPATWPSGILLAGVHYKSRLEWSEEEQREGAIKLLAPAIADEEDRFGHQRTVLVGDLNMNPFEPGVVSAFGLHAVMTQDLARREERTVAGQPYRFFYNPMWGYFGDRSPGPPGTYYLRSSRPGQYFWNIYDQVLLRPALMDRLVGEAILDHDGTESLLTRKGLPSEANASDHLPLSFQLDV